MCVVQRHTDSACAAMGRQSSRVGAENIFFFYLIAPIPISNGYDNRSYT